VMAGVRQTHSRTDFAPPLELDVTTPSSAPEGTEGNLDSFGARATLTVGDTSYEVFRLDAVEGSERLPYSLKILLENLLRTEDGANITAEHVRALAAWDPKAEPSTEIQFTPGRVVMQDFTGVPCIVDLATMREAVTTLGGDPSKVNPLAPAELVIDHSVIADIFGRPDAFERNVDLEYERNKERYQFLRWGQTAFDEFKVVPPGTGIVHQVNIEHLARVVMVRDGQAYPDTLVGTDSHTTMVNGLGVLGWGVGGIEAEAAMLGQPVSMLIPKVVGFKLHGELPAGATATDLVLTITEMLRKQGVVGKFVEFYGSGVSAVPLANRATIGNMSPEFGSTAAIFPIDAETIDYLRFTGRSAEQVALVEAYAKEQGLWHDPSVEPVFSEVLELDLASVVPSIAGPKRPQDRIELTAAKRSFRDALGTYATGEPRGAVDEAGDGSVPASDAPAVGQDAAPPKVAHSAATGATGRTSKPTTVTLDGNTFEIDHGAVAIAAITSCTNTSNPSVMIGAALLAKKAVERGLERKPWVKTTLAPGSKVVSDYFDRAGLTPYLDKLGFNLVGYGCTTCIGNSGPLQEEISAGVQESDLAVVSVLSGNRNFEGRINPDIKMNYLASPPLVVAYALAGSMDIDITTEPLGTGSDGEPVHLADIWPTPQEIQDTITSALSAESFSASYKDVFAGDERWQSLPTPTGKTFEWDARSTYVRKPPYFDGMRMETTPVTDITGARVLALLGDSVTTDHISPAGAIKADTPAGRYLTEHGVERGDFNSYGSRRGNHEVMIRGTFANIRLRNLLLAGENDGAGVQGGYTRDFTKGGEQAFIYDAAQNYADAGIGLVILAGKEYGSGSSRDWAAKGTSLLGVRAVIAESFERIHRSNLIGMGVLPLQFPQGTTAGSLGLDGTETFAVEGVTGLNDGKTPRTVTVTAAKENGTEVVFDADVRIDTPGEADYYRNGGIMQYVLRKMVNS
jgi:aconitate hydratase